MIEILAASPLHTRLIQEMLAPLGQNAQTYSADAARDAGSSALAVIWWDAALTPSLAETLAQEARRVIAIIPGGPNQESARLNAAEAGADAIFTTPVRGGQVTERARTFLNPAALERLPEQMALGPYEFWPRENRLVIKKTKEKLRLTDKERDILLTLKAAAGQPVTRQALLDAVWAYAPGVETHTLETHIYRLRQKIEPDPAAPQIVLTDEVGYKILTH